MQKHIVRRVIFSRSLGSASRRSGFSKDAIRWCRYRTCGSKAVSMQHSGTAWAERRLERGEVKGAAKRPVRGEGVGVGVSHMALFPAGRELGHRRYMALGGMCMP
jgi:hypothetical protein